MVISTCSSWFGVSGGGENISFATSKLGKVVSVKKNQGICVCSRFRVSDFVQVPKQKNSTKMKEKQDQKGEFCEN